MRLDYKFISYLVLSLVAGVVIAWMDSRPGWDNTGITAGTIVLVSALFGYLWPSRPWIWALTVSLWVPLHAIILSGDFKMLLVTLFGFAGSYLGAAVKNNKPSSPN
ncbi:MAG: hypothetical protein M0R39_11835 [Prolixibacteraceae bacterium]|jgi:hypothetical protein|nr:hypothetical protein [Prolixibacteraceae bacterium]